MKRIDRLIIGEIAGPWLFGVAIFTVMMMAGTYLFKITEFIVGGVPIAAILEYTLLLVPGIIALTFPMAVLLATLLAFGRLSGDSEVIAMKAVGTSVWRMMLPVAGFGFCISLMAYIITDFVVPRAAIRAEALKARIITHAEKAAALPTSYPIRNNNGELIAQLMARDFSISERTLSQATITVYDKEGEPEWIMKAKKVRFELEKGKLDPEKGWRLEGGATLFSADGMQVVNIKDDVWPAQVPKLNFEDETLVAANIKNADPFSSWDLQKQIDRLRKSKGAKLKDIYNLEFMRFNKFAIPLTALVYALVGAPLGIRSHRAGTATGFALSVIIIFAYLMITNFMAIYAQGGALPSWVASFLPLGIGLAVAAFAIHRKNS